MISDNKIISLIGMAYKARKIISGESILRKTIQDNNISLLIIAKDASNNTKKRFINSAKYYGVPYYIYLTKQDFSKSLGGKHRSVIGVMDVNFSKIIKEHIEILILKTGGELL